MAFFDEARIFVRGGDGGNGCVAFRRERRVPRGGPAGGDGGRGGDVTVEAVGGMNTLAMFRRRRHFKACRGGDGSGSSRAGAGADALRLRVPAGVTVFADDGETVVADLAAEGDCAVLAEGGRGGRGNAAFKTATRQAPRVAEPGRPGTERWLRLRLRLVADVGLVGLPNAGKSTFLAAVSRARPRIADYPFTTLDPHLGVAGAGDRELVVADIPGLIAGAHAGAGLGDRFLGHVERCAVLLHLIDATADDAAEDYRTVRRELAAYGAGVDSKPAVVGLNKRDAAGDDTLRRAREALAGAGAPAARALSGATGAGVAAVMAALAEAVSAVRPAAPAEPWRP